jgi:hypothetical protein
MQSVAVMPSCRHRMSMSLLLAAPNDVSNQWRENNARCQTDILKLFR